MCRTHRALIISRSHTEEAHLARLSRWALLSVILSSGCSTYRPCHCDDVTFPNTDSTDVHAGTAAISDPNTASDITAVSDAPKQYTNSDAPYARLVPGTVPLLGSGYHKPGAKLFVTKIWHMHNMALHDFYQSKFGTARITQVQILGTPYFLVFVSGKPQPLILDENLWELWEIQGLGEWFSNTTAVRVSQQQIEVSRVEQLADLDCYWLLDFSNQAAFSASYREEGGF